MSALIGVPDAAARAGVSDGLVRAWIKSGELPHYRLGGKGKRGKIGIDPADLEAFLRARRVDGAQQQPVTTRTKRASKSDDFTGYHQRFMEQAREKERRAGR